MTVSKGEKLIITMLADLYEKANIKDGLDAGLIKRHIDTDFWVIERKYSGIFGDGSERAPADIKFVQDILDMYRALEYGFKKLDPADKEKVKAAPGAHGEGPRFRGFDGHTEYAGIADTLISTLGGWSEFAGRSPDSHEPDTDMHERMWKEYETMRGSYSPLTADQIIQVLNARIHPEHR